MHHVVKATLTRMETSSESQCLLQFTPTQGHVSRSCLPFKSDCDPEWRDEIDVKMKCLNGDTSFVFDSNSLAYRNEFCAQCSFVDKLWCFAKRRRKTQHHELRLAPSVVKFQLDVDFPDDEDAPLAQNLKAQSRHVLAKAKEGQVNS